ncbi:cysteine--tRNA ligase [Candidatus Palauibacter sp.]|uniref:cysteine--tRNA ligase n=1 Tax=Candidatus Palauibacter sp. TaxID=3101350 RepID=UPI003AF2BD4A
MSLRLHDSLTRRLRTLEPVESGRVGMYTCGPTVYDRAHIGNFRAFTWEDLLRRYLRFKGYEVEQVMNLTDVDDRTIAAAAARGIPLGEVTGPVIEMFLEDWRTLGLEEPEHRPRATGHVDGMIRLIESLSARGLTYESDGSVYFAISRFPGYGRLAGIDPQGLTSASRATGDEEYDKDDPRDFVLWKGGDRGGDEKAVVVWDSPWGTGRPGWHLECSAMAMQYLGETLDIHAGGVDNLFPHHTNEIAQSEGATGKTFARLWLHAEHLLVEGRKMSKSLGNCFTIPELVARGHAPSAIRYLLLSGHYRTQLNFTFDGVEASEKAVTRLHEFRRRLSGAIEAGIDESADSSGLAERSRAAFESAMDDDLNVSEALAAVFGLVREVNHLLDTSRPRAPGGAETVLAAIDDFDRVFGVLALRDLESADADEELVAWATARAGARERARADRDYALADAVRAELEARGVAVEDLADRTRLRLGARTIVVPRPGL